MSSRFLVTGLPRSRTAWMSLAATTARSICYHEPISRLGRWQDVSKLWRGGDYEHIGVSDSSMGFHLYEILASSAPRTLIIERDIKSVLRSLERINVSARAYCELLLSRIADAGSHQLIKRVSYDDLQDSEIVAQCLRWLMPGVDIDMNKLEELQKMNVQADMEFVWRTANERRADMPELLGQDVFDELKTLSMVA